MKDTGGYIRDAKELQVMQSYPLWMKVMLTKQRIREWVYQFGEDGVVVSFSGGKDSWENWNPKKIWVPSKKGLGLGRVFDMCNEIYGHDFMRYE